MGTIILFKDIDKYAFMCGSIFYETDVIYKSQLKKWLCWQIIFVIVSIGILIDYYLIQNNVFKQL